jgi:hypothetical protein
MALYQVDVSTEENGVLYSVRSQSRAVASTEGGEALAERVAVAAGSDPTPAEAADALRYRDLLEDAGVVTVGEYTARLHRWPGREEA